MHTGRSPDPTPSAPMTEADEPEMDLVQKLFEKSLGPPRSCNDIPTSRASSHGAPWREAEEIKFKVARGRALDYQVVPSTGALVGLSYVPARLPSHSAQRKGQLPAPAQPAHSTLWALLQPHSGLGINTALSVVDSSGGRQSGFSSWCQQGFLDVTPRASLEYSLTQHPGSNLTAEADLIATLPKLPLLPQLTARHKLVAALSTPGVQHGSTLSMPLLGGGAVARVQVQEPAAGSLHAGSVLSVSLEGRNNSSRGLAGGVSLSPSLSSAFKGSAFATTSGALSCSGGGSSSSHGEGSSRAGSDSDDDGGGSGGSMADRHRRRQVPGLRLQMQPGAVRSWEDVSGRWQQPWGSRLKSTLQYQAQQRRWGLDLCQKLGSSLTAAGSLSWEGPASLAAPADDEETACGTAAARQLLRHVVSYGRGSHPRRAALKLVCCLPASMPGGAKSRRRLQLETAYDLDAGLATHGLKLRLGGRGGNAAHLQRQRYDLAVTKRQRQVDVTLDFFAPL